MLRKKFEPLCFVFGNKEENVTASLVFFHKIPYKAKNHEN